MSRIERTIEQHDLRKKTDEELDFMFRDSGEAWEKIREHSPNDAVKYADICFAISRVEGERNPVQTRMTATEARAADGKL